MKTKVDWRLLLALFREMFVLAACVIGGGYVILSVADVRLSTKRKWLRQGELLEVLPIFQMIPGIIGGHTAVYIGNRVAGTLGAAVAALGMITPSVLIFLGVSIAYHSIPIDNPILSSTFLGLRSALAGIMLDLTFRTWRKSVAGVYGYAAIILATAAMTAGGFSPGWVIAAGMLLGLLIVWLSDWRKRSSSAPSSRVFRSFWAIPLLFVGYGLIAFGGGFVLVPVYIRDFVGEAAPFLQLASDDFANVMAMTEMTPGPVAVNCATYFGHALGGIAGAFFATFSLLLPGSIILLIALKSIERFRTSVIVRGVIFGVKPVTMALVVCATWSFLGMSAWSTSSGSVAFSPLGIVLVAGVFLGVYTKRIGVIQAILGSAVIAALFGFFT